MAVFQTSSGAWFESPDSFSQDPDLLRQGVVRTPSGFIQVPRHRVSAYMSAFDEPAAQPEPPLRSHFEEEGGGVSLADYGRRVMSGFAGLGQSVGWLLRRAGAKDLGELIEREGKEAVDFWHQGLSEDMRDAMARQFIVKNEETGEYEWGDANIHTVLGSAAESIPGTMAGMGLGAGLSRVLQLFANPVGRGALVAAVSDGMRALGAAKAGDVAAQAAVRTGYEAAKRLAVVDKVIGAVGFGLGEGAVGGVSTGVNVYEQVMQLPAEKIAENPRYQEIYGSTDSSMSELERHQYAADTVAREASTLAGFQAGLTTSLLGAPMGAYFGSLLGRSALGSMAQTVPRAVTTGAAGEAAQEFLQSGTEALIANRQLGRLDPDVDIMDDVLNQAVGGALAGAALGGAAGTAGRDSAQARPAQKSPATGSPARVDPNMRLRQAADEALAAGARQEDVDDVLQRVSRGEMPVLVGLGELRKRGQAARPMDAESQIRDDDSQAVDNVNRGTSQLKPEDIPEYDGLSREDREIERRFAARIAADPDGMERAYAELPDAMGGKMLNADAARELSPDYLADRTKSAAVHEPSTFLMARMYDKALASEPAPGDEPRVVFTAGGTGAGKTSSLNAALAADPELGRAQVFVDSNMAKSRSAIQKIDRALAAGKDVTILYTYRDPVDALINGVIPRAQKQAAVHGSGRTLSLAVHAQTHVGSRQAMAELVEHYRGDDRVHFQAVNNSFGRGQARVVPIESLPELSYNSTVRSLNEAIDREFAAGRIPERIYRAIRGETQGAQALQQEAGAGRGEGAEQPRQGREAAAVTGVAPRVLFEAVPSTKTAAGRKIADLPFEQRQEFSRRAAAAVDYEAIARAAGLPEGTRAEAGRGMWQGAPNPGLIESVPPGVPREAVDRMAGAIADIHRQDSVLWYRPEETESSAEQKLARIEEGTHAPTAYIELQRELTEDEQQVFDEEFEEAFGELSYTAAGQQIITIDFSGAGAEAWEARLNDFNARAALRGLPINLDASSVFLAEVGSANRNWEEVQAEGVGGAEALQDAVAGSSALRQAVLRAREQVARIEAEYAPEEEVAPQPALLSRRARDASRDLTPEEHHANHIDSVAAEFRRTINEEFRAGGMSAQNIVYGFEFFAEQSYLDPRELAPAVVRELQKLPQATSKRAAELIRTRYGALLSRKPLPAGIERVAQHLTPEERAKLRADSAQKILDLFEQLPPVDEFVAAARAGEPKRGWYQQSAEAIRTVFGDVDAPRFVALLAALSPQTDVESNLYNALRTWNNWDAAGRPTDRNAIVSIMGQSVQGSGTEESVLGAWINNAVRALSTPDPVKIVLSGPKVNSFMLNLLGDMQEVTNDAWMANFALVDQALFSGRLNVSGTDPGKVPGYLAMSAKVRAAAAELGWTPAEVQETIWSWAKTVYEMADARGELRSIEQLVEDNAISDAAISATPDFGTMFVANKTMHQILEEAGYVQAIEALARTAPETPGGSRAAPRGQGAARAGESQALRRAARRLDALREQRRGQTGRPAEVAARMARERKAALSRSTPAPGGQLAADVRAALARQIKAVDPIVRVEVAQSPAEHGFDEGVEGAMLPNGTVMLFADSLPAGREQEVFVHEVFGHVAMERTPFGKQAIDMVLSMRGHKTMAPLWEEIGQRWGVLDDVTHAKEVIAVMAERGDKHAVITRLIAGVRAFLRRLGIVREYSEADVRALIARAARALRVDVNAALADNERLRGLTPESSDEDILAAIDEAIPPDVVEIDKHLHPTLMSRAAPAEPDIQALIDTKLARAPEEFTLRDRVRRWLDDKRKFDGVAVKQGLIDSFASLEALEREFNNGELLDASQSAYKAALATKYSGDVFAATMIAGVPEYRDGTYVIVPGRKGIIEIFDVLTKHRDGNLLRQWELYAAAVRAQRLIKETNPDGTQREKLFTQQEIDTALKLGEKYPEFKTVMREWNAFNKQILDLAQDAGIIDPEARAVWEKNDYVPFYRATEELRQGPRNRRGVANQRSGIRTLKGEDKPLGNVFENMMLNTAHLIDASIKNRAMQKAVGLGVGTALQPVPMDWLPVKFTAEQLARALESAGVVPKGEGTGIVNAMTPQQRQQWVTLFRRMAPKGQDIVSVMVNGRPEYYRVTDPLVLSSLTGMGMDSFSGILKILRGPKKLLTTAVAADPAFMLANAVRDTLSTWVVTPGLSPMPMLRALKGAKDALTGDKVVLDMMMAGAVGGGFYDTNPEEMRKLIALKVPKGQRSPAQFVADTPAKLWRAWRRIGSASEQMNRIVRFREVLRAGGTVAEAAYQARDVLNFRKSGDYEAMRWLVQTVPFLNARIQGLFRLYTGARDNRRAFFIKGATLMAITLALAARNDDDDRYNELPDWQKDTYWWWFFDDPKQAPIAIPKPFEVGAMFGTVPERMMRFATGRDSTKTLVGSIKRMFADTFAFNPIPQAFKPAIEQYANRTFFFGTPIVGMAEQRLQPEAQFDPWTSETMRAIADAMPDFAPAWLRSPARLEAAMRGYTGTLGMYALSASDAIVRNAMGFPDEPARRLHDLPVVRRFIKDPQPRTTRYTTVLYDMMNEANALYSTINRYRREQRLEDARRLMKENRGKLVVRVRLNRLGAQMRNINNQIRLIQISRTMTSQEKRERIDKLVARKNEIARKVAGFEDLF